MPAAPQPHPGGITRYAGRSTRRYRAQRKAFRNHCQQNNLPCWLCGQPINYDLPAGHPEAFNLDHIYPVIHNPELAEDPANFRPSHATCNDRRGDNEPFIQLGNLSEPW